MQGAPKHLAGRFEGTYLGQVRHKAEERRTRFTFHVLEKNVMLTTAAVECFHIEEIRWNAGRGGVEASHVPVAKRSRIEVGGGLCATSVHDRMAQAV